MVRDRRLVWFGVSVVVVVVIAFGFVLGRWTDDDSAADPIVVSGWATTDYDYTALVLYEKQDLSSQGKSFAISRAHWSDREGSWQSSDSPPSCFDETTISVPVRVELGYVNANSSDKAPGSEVVVWLRCL